MSYIYISNNGNLRGSPGTIFFLVVAFIVIMVCAFLSGCAKEGQFDTSAKVEQKAQQLECSYTHDDIENAYQAGVEQGKTDGKREAYRDSTTLIDEARKEDYLNGWNNAKAEDGQPGEKPETEKKDESND